jgi:uncharacterized OB-fold protein/acyl dehydratase
VLADERAGLAAERIRSAADRIIELGESAPRLARDPVNVPMIENWVEAIGDDNPVYVDPDIGAASVHGELVAPPAMTQVWTMAGQRTAVGGSDPMSQIVKVLEEAGYTSVVATNADHVFRRYLRLGERPALRIRLAALTGPKRTALGEGWFFTTRHTWYSGDEVVATMDFRILKFRPSVAGGGQVGPGRPADERDGPVMRPVISPDTKFFWDGLAAGELRIQRCRACGALRHPPGPMCPACGSSEAGYLVASGTGVVFSYVVHHHPPVPGKTLPLVIALVELDEGVRVVGEMPGVQPDEVSVGAPVRLEFLRVDDDLTLPAWLPAGRGAHQLAQPDGTESREPGLEELPAMTVDVTPTFVVASALATRDFTPVHHDRDLAVANGGKDIFLNILTDTGLVQRFLTQWAGPQALVREISVRLGIPCYAGDTLTFSGQVTARTRGPDGDRCAVRVAGRCGLGDHIIATAVVDLPGGPA